jgi:DNA-directed RNA polymerase specialized sigma24 family protein
MDRGARSPDRNLKINPVDRLGRMISPLVLDAAEQIARRAIYHAEKLFIDPAVATTLLEQAAATVTRAIESRGRCADNAVRDLRAYLFRAFIRRINKAKRRQSFLEESARAIALESNKPIHPQPSLDLKILVDELLTRSDSMTRDMFYRRVQGFSWQEIGISHGISGHAAEKHFNQSIHKIRQKLGPRER